MKRIFTTAFFALAFTSLFGQSAQLFDHNNAVINNGDTVSYFSNNIEASEHFLEFKIKNTSSATVSYKVRQISISIIGNSSRSFCFSGSCFPPFVNLSTSSLALNTNETSSLSDFSTHYQPYEFVSGNLITYPGTSIVAYTVFNEASPTDSTYFVIKYTVIDATKIENTKLVYSIGNIYPNPTSNYFQIKYQISNARNTQIEIVNILGSKVLSQNISTTSNNAKIDVKKLKPGVYLYYFVIDGLRTEAKKLIIQ